MTNTFVKCNPIVTVTANQIQLLKQRAKWKVGHKGWLASWLASQLASSQPSFFFLSCLLSSHSFQPFAELLSVGGQEGHNDDVVINQTITRKCFDSLAWPLSLSFSRSRVPALPCLDHRSLGLFSLLLHPHPFHPQNCI